MNLNTAKGRLKLVTIKGVELTRFVRSVSVRESICSSFLTCEIIFADTNNIINNLQLVGGEQIIINMDAPPNNRSYDVDMYLLTVNGEPSPENLKTIIYTISAVGSEYFTDRENLTQEAKRNMTGAQLAQKIWSDCGFKSKLSIPVQDSLLSDGNEPFQIHQLKPFTAISHIRDMMNIPQYKTGNVLLFRDINQEVMAPLQYLFDSMSAQEYFIQKATWGSSWHDIFESEHAIIDIRQQTRNQSGGGSTMQDVAASAKQGKRVFDMMAGKMASNLILAQPIISAAKTVASFASGSIGAGGLGGFPNIQSTNSDRTKSGQDYTQKTEIERAYASNIKACPQYSVRVPFQCGINCTVGKGVQLNIMPPSGDTVDMTGNPSGVYLITDIVHTVKNTIEQVTGFSSFLCNKGAA